VANIGTRIQGFLAAAAAIALCASATPSSAAEIFLRSLSMDGAYQANISGPSVATPGYPSINENGLSNIMKFQANDGVGQIGSPHELLAFCVDIFDNIGLGGVNLQYHTSTLTQDGNGDALLGQQIHDITSLVTYGTKLYHLGDTDLSRKLSGVQAAIWKIENPLYTIAPSDSAVTLYMNNYVALAPSLHGSIYTIYPDTARSQGFAISNGVPEPATWTMMILGFGGVGAVLRRRRQAVALA
jgi:hypothetical protein